ncbi:hypothetical protein GGI25_004867 [Coemansia spiralis]|uniref:Uncharacterized protein n=2 Tax=Coemansia TaxID=4863 RepID=A0A9W8KW86_9FUNG|nr:hypothetical protein BX070DRAFT_234532 [Coemansia spiralis]KAJ1991936.1 hypothetical protein EDC05_003090 [Coemansia umbellata]KAJ2625307.1 hypothetical protein GGI26_000777 [Coemansia sp. RSA 1358]KAJ2673052.1 hypothetical protein GGI25_004867 [Coemansia spiralis]
MMSGGVAFEAKGKRRYADVNEAENAADDTLYRLSSKRRRNSGSSPRIGDGFEWPLATTLAEGDYCHSATGVVNDHSYDEYSSQMEIDICAPLHLKQLQQMHPAQYHSGIPYMGALLATPATSPPQAIVDSVETSDECEDEPSELDPSSEYYKINLFLNQLHHERMMRQRQRQLQLQLQPQQLDYQHINGQ